MIPKILHFVWVGTQEKPELVKKCIASWKKYCPDYEIMEWGNDSLADIDNVYVQQAFAAKKWAFVSDFLRLYALKKFGGFYLDTDVEITQSIDKFRNNKFITGYEKYHEHIMPFTALVGAEPNNPIISYLLSEYDGVEFVLPDGSYNQMTNTARVAQYWADKYGVTRPYDGTVRTLLGDDGVLEPWWYFCTPADGRENYTIHHFNGSWLDGWGRKRKLKLGRYSVVRFRRRLRVQSDIIPLTPHEKLIFRIRTGRTRFFALIKANKK